MDPIVHPGESRFCRVVAFGLVLALGMMNGSLIAADWPMWRGDSMRSAASTESLAPNLRIEHVIAGTPRKQTWDDPLNMDVMSFDRVFEPIILGSQLFVGFNDSDKVISYDLHSGKVIEWCTAKSPKQCASRSIQRIKTTIVT